MSRSHRAVILFGISALLGLLVPFDDADATSGDLPRLIYRVAGEEKVDAGLLRAIVAVESANNAGLISEKGAVGLMQLMPATARALGVTNRFDAEQCLRGGARYIKRLIAMYPNLSLALAAYNAGPGNVDKFGGIPPFPETKSYVRRVMAKYAKSIPPRKALPQHTARRRAPIVVKTQVVLERKDPVVETKLASSTAGMRGPEVYGFLHRSSYLASRQTVSVEVMDRDAGNSSADTNEANEITEVPILRLIYN
ncbi:MAG: lytic transglycosylase domain-containing protein [Magnetococcales bacterium]|nr:lytic transglycosylase domain-containing protein [Magnetococcales bacterium]